MYTYTARALDTLLDKFSFGSIYIRSFVVQSTLHIDKVTRPCSPFCTMQSKLARYTYYTLPSSFIRIEIGYFSHKYNTSSWYSILWPDHNIAIYKRASDKTLNVRHINTRPHDLILITAKLFACVRLTHIAVPGDRSPKSTLSCLIGWKGNPTKEIDPIVFNFHVDMHLDAYYAGCIDRSRY